MIYGKLLNIMRESGSVGKDRQNTQQGYKFRGIDDVMNELHEKFSQNGVFILTEILDQRREERPTKSGGINIYSINIYRFTFMAEDGSFVQSTQVGEGMDNGDKASNKAASVALKYALLFMFLIPTEDAKDPENDSHDLKADKKQADNKPAAPSKPAQLPSSGQQQANDFDKKAASKRPATPVPLLPSLPLWEQVTTWLKDKQKTEEDWKELRKNYVISEADEAKLIDEVWSLPF